MDVELARESLPGINITTLIFRGHERSGFQEGSDSTFGKLVAKILNECSKADAPSYVGYRINPPEVKMLQKCQVVVELSSANLKLLDQIAATLIGAAEYVVVGVDRAEARYIELAHPLSNTISAGNMDRDIFMEIDSQAVLLKTMFPSKVRSALSAYLTATSEEFTDVIISISLGLIWYYHMIERGETSIPVSQ